MTAPTCRTGTGPKVCSRSADLWRIGDTCPACGHHGMVHPGRHTGLATCLLCDLLDVLHEVRDIRDQLQGEQP